MFEIRVEKTFAAAHKLKGYKGKCEKLHGHNWKIEAVIRGSNLDKTGLLYDFSDVKKGLKKIIEKFDHEVLNRVPPFNRINPSSENIAKTIFEKLLVKYPVSRVTCWESDTSCASYFK